MYIVAPNILPRFNISLDLLPPLCAIAEAR
jgi:hypothetical protein